MLMDKYNNRRGVYLGVIHNEFARHSVKKNNEIISQPEDGYKSLSFVKDTLSVDKEVVLPSINQGGEALRFQLVEDCCEWVSLSSHLFTNPRYFVG